MQDQIIFAIITPWRLYAPDILMFSTGSQEYLTVGLLHGN